MSSRSARVFARSLVSTAERERHAMIESTASSERRAAGFAAASSSTACSTADPIRARACRHAELDGRYLDDGIGGAVSLAFELCLDELARDALELEVDGSTARRTSSSSSPARDRTAAATSPESAAGTAASSRAGQPLRVESLGPHRGPHAIAKTGTNRSSRPTWFSQTAWLSGIGWARLDSNQGLTDYEFVRPDDGP
jgi:hypothetical protein